MVWGKSKLKACQEALEKSQEGKAYLEKRGIPEDVWRRFGVGLCTDETWKKPALVLPDSAGRHTKRFISEVYDSQGELIRYSVPKDAHRGLANLEALKDGKKGPIFITEGIFDAMSVEAAGCAAIALPSATGWRELLTELHSNPTDRPLILCLDRDDTGRKNEADLQESLEEAGFLAIPENLVLPGKNDLNESLTADRQAFFQAVVKAVKRAMVRAEDFEKEKAEAEKKRKEDYKKSYSAAGFLDAFMDGIKASVNTPAIPTGFKKLDSVLDGGLYEGLYFVGAISSLGKTTLVLQIADQIAASGKDVLIFSLEMARTELISKSISRLTYTNSICRTRKDNQAKTARGITDGTRYAGYSKAELQLIQDSIQQYAGFAEHIFIHEGIGSIGVSEVRHTLEDHVKITGSVPVVIVDYLQILAPVEVRASDKQNTDKSVLELKRLSRDYKTPVIGISSLNRESYEKELSMKSFKESGAIEYSCDVLIGLELEKSGQDTDGLQAKRKKDRAIKATILKNRNGQVGEKINFRYFPMFNFFEEKKGIDD